MPSCLQILCGGNCPLSTDSTLFSPDSIIGLLVTLSDNVTSGVGGCVTTTTTGLDGCVATGFGRCVTTGLEGMTTTTGLSSTGF